MAYNSNVQIIPGDILFTTFQSSVELYPFNVICRNVSGESVVSASKVPPTLTTSQYPSARNALEISPNGRYIVYSSSTFGSASPTGITVWDLDDNTFTTFASVGSFHRFYFTTDSSTMLVASNTAPFIYAFDLVNKLAKGTITGGPTFANMSMKAAAYGGYLYVIATGSGSTGDFYRYNKTTNALTAMGIAHAFQFSDIAIDPVKGYVFLTNGSTGTGRYINVYDLNSMGTAPAQISTSVFIASTNGVVAPLGYYACAQAGTNALKIGKLTYGANVTSTTMTDVSPSTTLSVSNSTLVCQYVYDNVLFTMITTPPYVYPNWGSHVRTFDFNTYTSGAINPVINPGPNTDLGAYCIHPAFARRKLAGHVYDKDDNPVARKVVVAEHNTKRVIGEATSASGTGVFTIPVFTTAQCAIYAVGTGSEMTKIVDYVEPVSV